jgi:hypothetical protein
MGRCAFAGCKEKKKIFASSLPLLRTRYAIRVKVNLTITRSSDSQARQELEFLDHSPLSIYNNNNNNSIAWHGIRIRIRDE